MSATTEQLTSAPSSDASNARIGRLFRTYRDEELIRVTRNEFAYANDVFELTTINEARYVMRVLREAVPKSVEIEANAQIRLRANGVRSATYVQFPDGRYLGEDNGTFFTLSKKIEGIPPGRISLELAADFGATLARIHGCWEGMETPPNKLQWLNRENAAASLAEYEGVHKSDAQGLFDRTSHLFDLGLTETVIHGDLWPGNAFADGDRVTAVFDLERAEHAPRTLDIARTCVAVGYESKYSLFNLGARLRGGYDSVAAHSLTGLEQESFHLAVAYVAGVCAVWHAAKNNPYAARYLEMGEEALQTTN
jgi:Ser/Thr protein kinase RdoA (MazF antagonist)